MKVNKSRSLHSSSSWFFFCFWGGGQEGWLVGGREQGWGEVRCKQVSAIKHFDVLIEECIAYNRTQRREYGQSCLESLGQSS